MYLVKSKYSILMSFLAELQSKRDNLKPTSTTITYADGSRVQVQAASDAVVVPLEAKNYGFVIDTKPDQKPACILNDFLYLGSQDSVILENIEQFGITDVLSVGIETPTSDISKDEAVDCHFVPCLDLPETELRKIFKQTNGIINSVREKKRAGRVLVHCNAGVSRSASVCIAYLMFTQRMTFTDAFNLVKSKRECIQPNSGFLRQLKELDTEIAVLGVLNE